MAGEDGQPHGPWRILASRQVYRDPWIDVRRDEVIRPDGAPGSHCVVAMKPGVCVLPLDDDGCVHLTEEFHYAVGRVGLEAVSGGIEPGEDALTTAGRELEEELGLLAREWTPLGVIDPFTTIIVSPIRLFLARGLSPVKERPEGTEQIRRVRIPLAEADERVRDGRISHAPTCVLVLKTQALLETQENRKGMK